MEIKDKVALITGGAHRVGQAITLALAAAGANVVVHYRSSAAGAEETAAQARRLGVKALTVQADISQAAQVKAMAGYIKAEWAGLDILINSASTWEKSPFPSDDLGPWERVTAVAIHGTYYTSNTFVPLMLERGGGAIINILDLSAWEAWPDFTAHAVGKSAMLAMTRQFALELAPSVRVNAVAPGPVLPAAHYGPATLKRLAGRTLLNRWGTAGDVARAVEFLIEADYITGETIFVDGGERYGRYKRPQE